MSGIYLLFIALSGLGMWLWNGYMDGYLALYTAVGCLYLARWLSTEDLPDALLGITALAMTASLKNEGDLLILCVAASVTAVFLVRRRSIASLRGMVSLPVILTAVFAFLGPLIWQVLIRRWGLTSEMPSSPLNMQLIGTRLHQGAAGTIAATLFMKADVAKAAAILVCTAIAGRVIRRRTASGLCFISLIAFLYGFAMFWIYLTTNADLSWHLGTSATRTMLPVILLIVTATYLCLADLEETSESPPSLPVRNHGERIAPINGLVDRIAGSRTLPLVIVPGENLTGAPYTRRMKAL